MLLSEQRQTKPVLDHLFTRMLGGDLDALQVNHDRKGHW
jgi:hypothetical protein